MSFPIVSYGITLTEVPDHIALFLEFGNCQLRCKGCHSESLWRPVEKQMTSVDVCSIAKKYKELGANAVVLMGGTTNGVPMSDLGELITMLKNNFGNCIGLFSGLQKLEAHSEFLCDLRWIKVGPYEESLGGLRSPLTNQRFYEIINNVPINKTYLFRRDASV